MGTRYHSRMKQPIKLQSSNHSKHQLPCRSSPSRTKSNFLTCWVRDEPRNLGCRCYNVIPSQGSGGCTRSVWSNGGIIVSERNTKKFEGNPAPVPLRIPWNSHKLTRDWTRVSVVVNHRVIAWAMARPCSRTISSKRILSPTQDCVSFLGSLTSSYFARAITNKNVEWFIDISRGRHLPTPAWLMDGLVTPSLTAQVRDFQL
jgi:hypothetical protein